MAVMLQLSCDSTVLKFVANNVAVVAPVMMLSFSLWSTILTLNELISNISCHVSFCAACHAFSVDPTQDLTNYQMEKFSKKFNKITLENLVKLPHKHWKANYCFQFSSFMHFINI
jgi:ribosomal protein L31